LLAVAKEAPETVTLIEQLNKVMMKMVNLVMHFAPYAVFCLIAKAISELGLELLKELLGYALVLVGALLFHALVSYSLILKILTGLNPRIFLKKLRAAQTFAFSTASSGATIPITLRTVEERLGVNNSIASFTVPLGATINMDGTAMMQGVATVFIANVYGIDLSAVDYLMVILMAVLASIGTAAVPSVGLVMLTMVFNEVNLPVEGIGLILGVDRILDMLRTAVNVTGDAAISTIVAKSENRFDREIYENPEAGIITD
ncbi:MAG: dicarboxylate/amino acid:cation symporter, partial [Pseudomonadales bacterium]